MRRDKDWTLADCETLIYYVSNHARGNIPRDFDKLHLKAWEADCHLRRLAERTRDDIAEARELMDRPNPGARLSPVLDRMEERLCSLLDRPSRFTF